ncbi:t-cell immunomodulatory protein [Holotrichia oblita]|uniref:T-cell immunomodulatory protein n=1 Tax=Holotrichia oblita TaxID=644536 RepID=A0ACB9T2C6_HOLOL|nr:t-cell immunomodulatory protein [Holotrichia oblita]
MLHLNKTRLIILFLNLLNSEVLIQCSDITNNVFSSSLTDSMPAAFGDFNSDELTDIFVIRDKERTLEIFLADEEEPLLRTPSQPLKCNFSESQKITSVVPGDFDGDALMDVLVTVHESGDKKFTHVYIMWGGATYLNCTTIPLFKMIGQPLAIDYNQDMIVDLFGTDEDEHRSFWLFDKNRNYFRLAMRDADNFPKLKDPHAHAFIDLNEDFTADLFLTTKENFEIWYGTGQKFIYNSSIPYPKDAKIIGQSSFIDVELRGRMDLVTPVCFDHDCKNSTLLVYSDNQWHNLQVNFKDPSNNIWNLYYKKDSMYTDTITLHSGDFNMDGYPDILATLALNSQPQSFLLENVPCENSCGHFKRSYIIRWDALRPYTNGTVMAAFFDFYQDGVLDIIMVKHNGTGYKSAAFKNSLDYDANFIKVMVLTGLQ